MVGTLINVATVAIGTVLGTVLGDRLPARIRETVMHALGLVTLIVGAGQAFQLFAPPLSDHRASVVVILGAILIGGILGELMRIESGLERAGEALKRRFGKGQARFVEGFVVASLVFCVGPLTILGSIQDGLTGDYDLLAIKSLLDGFAAMAFASALGWGVGFSIITILVYQGGLSLAASGVESVFTPVTIAALTAAGGILILGIGLRLLELRQIRIANLLPALVLAPVGMALVERFAG